MDMGIVTFWCLVWRCYRQECCPCAVDLVLEETLDGTPSSHFHPFLSLLS